MASVARHGDYVAALVLVAVSALLLVALAQPASAQQPAVPQPQLPQLHVNVSKAVLRLIIYPDGAVKPVYSLEATASLGSAGVKGVLELGTRGRYTGTESNQTARLRLHLEGLQGEAGKETVAANVTAQGSYWFERGNGEAVLHLKASYRGGGKSGVLVVRELRARLVEARRVDMVLDAVLPASLLRGNATGRAPSLQEVNRRLAENGLGFIHVKTLSITLMDNGSVAVRLHAVLDIDAMLAAAERNGLSRSDADTVRSLLASPHRVEGGFRLDASLRSGGGVVDARLSYSSGSRGDLEALSRQASRASGSIAALAAALLQPLAAKNPEAAIAVTQVVSGSRLAGGRLLLEKPPSESSTELRVAVEKGVARISLRYSGARLYAPSSTPSASAEKTLALLAEQYQQLLSMLAQFEIIAPGVSRVLPTVAALEPAAPCVKLSQARATLAQLAAVKVDLSSCKPQPAENTTATSKPGGGTTATATTSAATSTSTATGRGGAGAATSPAPVSTTSTTSTAPAGSAPTSTATRQPSTTPSSTAPATRPTASSSAASSVASHSATSAKAGSTAGGGGAVTTAAAALGALVLVVAAAALLARRR